MKKTYTDIENDPVMAAEPIAPYTVSNSCQALPKGSSTREQVLANTVSVDEYFDELISQVREDYASL